MRLKIYIIIGLLLSLVKPAWPISVKEPKIYHFVVRSDKEIELRKPFKVTIMAYDHHNRLVRNYNRLGNDLSITTTGEGAISPRLVSAASFKAGQAVVYFTYDLAGDTAKVSPFDIIATPIEKKLLRGEYLVGQGAVLEISVWEAEGLTKEVIVTPDGMISFPLIGEIKAQGRTLKDLDHEITEKLKAYVRQPQVSIMVKKLGGRRVIVLGEVRSPGVYETTGQGTVIEAIGLAGGTTKDAITRSVAIVRGNLEASPQVTLLNLDRVFTQGLIPSEYIIQPEDIVYVPRAFISSVSYFVTQFLPGLNLLYRTPFFLTK